MLTIIKDKIKKYGKLIFSVAILAILIYGAFNIKIEITQQQHQHQYQEQSQTQKQWQSTIIINSSAFTDLESFEIYYDKTRQCDKIIGIEFNCTYRFPIEKLKELKLSDPRLYPFPAFIDDLGTYIRIYGKRRKQ